MMSVGELKKRDASDQEKREKNKDVGMMTSSLKVGFFVVKMMVGETSDPKLRRLVTMEATIVVLELDNSGSSKDSHLLIGGEDGNDKLGQRGLK
ncbi:hypothetical protein Ancab_016005 [Ancistrocladus abbreviatus]